MKWCWVPTKLLLLHAHFDVHMSWPQFQNIRVSLRPVVNLQVKSPYAEHCYWKFITLWKWTYKLMCISLKHVHIWCLIPLAKKLHISFSDGKFNMVCETCSREWFFCYALSLYGNPNLFLFYGVCNFHFRCGIHNIQCHVSYLHIYLRDFYNWLPSAENWTWASPWRKTP